MTTCTGLKLQGFTYKIRDIGYGSDEGHVYGYITSEVDTWGKRTIHVVRGDGNLESWYLFPDEYEVDTP